MSILQGWHRGERAIQTKLGYAGPMSQAYTWIEAEMPEQHRTFHTTRLPFIPVTTLDASGRPWSSIFASHSGEPGFVSSPSWNRLDMDIRVWEGDPFTMNVKLFDGEKMLLAGIGIEFSTRRRNKFAGYVTDIRHEGDTYQLKMVVNQAIGNCPKYINVRELDAHATTAPTVIHNRPRLANNERLPDELVDLILASDTVFLGTTYQAAKADEATFPSHVGQNQRAGKPGFIRVKPSDGRTIVLPDYSGNRLMTSLGNVEATPLAALTFVDFKTGDILYLTGDARTLVGSEAHAVMPRQNVVTTVHVSGFIFVRDALPVRQRLNTVPQRSPYSPPIRLLAEELAEGTASYFDDSVSVTLAQVKLHSKDLATFTWETAKPIHAVPGQTAILDFTDLVGAAQYQHMSHFKPTSVNDDRIRTWTISSAHLAAEGTTSFDLTMREKPGGLITGALFTVARKLADMRPELLEDARPMGLQVKLVGIAGSFTLSMPSQPQGQLKVNDRQSKSLLWLAGGIGVTPFMSMLTAITRSSHDTQWEIVLGLATREPEVLVPLLLSTLEGDTTHNLRLAIHVFSNNPVPSQPSIQNDGNLSVSVHPHNGRITSSFLTKIPDVGSRDVYLCGPESFERDMLGMLADQGIPESKVTRESFEY